MVCLLSDSVAKRAAYFNRKAKVLYEAKRFDEALIVFSQAISFRPDPEYLLNRAAVLLEMGEYRLASFECRVALMKIGVPLETLSVFDRTRPYLCRALMRHARALFLLRSFNELREFFELSEFAAQLSHELYVSLPPIEFRAPPSIEALRALPYVVPQFWDAYEYIPVETDPCRDFSFNYQIDGVAWRDVRPAAQLRLPKSQRPSMCFFSVTTADPRHILNTMNSLICTGMGIDEGIFPSETFMRQAGFDNTEQTHTFTRVRNEVSGAKPRESCIKIEFLINDNSPEIQARNVLLLSSLKLAAYYSVAHPSYRLGGFAHLSEAEHELIERDAQTLPFYLWASINLSVRHHSVLMQLLAELLSALSLRDWSEHLLLAHIEIEANLKLAITEIYKRWMGHTPSLLSVLQRVVPPPPQRGGLEPCEAKDHRFPNEAAFKAKWRGCCMPPAEHSEGAPNSANPIKQHCANVTLLSEQVSRIASPQRRRQIIPRVDFLSVTSEDTPSPVAVSMMSNINIISAEGNFGNGLVNPAAQQMHNRAFASSFEFYEKEYFQRWRVAMHPNSWGQVHYTTLRFVCGEMHKIGYELGALQRNAASAAAAGKSTPALDPNSVSPSVRAALEAGGVPVDPSTLRFHVIDLGSAPDQTGILNALLIYRPLLHDEGLLQSHMRFVLGRYAAAGASTYLWDQARIYDDRLLMLLGYRRALLSPFDVSVIANQLKPNEVRKLFEMREVHFWLSSLFLSIVYPRRMGTDLDTINLIPTQPLSLFMRVCTRILSYGVPQHWVVDLLEQICHGLLSTPAAVPTPYDEIPSNEKLCGPMRQHNTELFALETHFLANLTGFAVSGCEFYDDVCLFESHKAVCLPPLPESDATLPLLLIPHDICIEALLCAVHLLFRTAVADTPECALQYTDDTEVHMITTVQWRRSPGVLSAGMWLSRSWHYANAHRYIVVPYSMLKEFADENSNVTFLHLDEWLPSL